MSSQPQATPALLGVGILGAGPVTQAIHLPSLARLGNILEVRHIMDVDPAVAEAVAGRVGASFSTSMEELLADPAVDIVAICSPHQFHAAQVIAACRAGKKAVLCEKPFAMTGEEAAGISAVSAETGVPIIVGAMHTFDPGWLAAEAAWDNLPEQVHTVRSSIVLPPNTRFEDFATEIVGRIPLPGRDSTDPEVIKAMLTGGVMGLAIHDLPLVRRFTPDFAAVEVLHAELVRPFGYVISLRAGNVAIELRAAMNGTWEPSWAIRGNRRRRRAGNRLHTVLCPRGFGHRPDPKGRTGHRPGPFQPQRIRRRVAQTGGTGQRYGPAAVRGNAYP